MDTGRQKRSVRFFLVFLPEYGEGDRAGLPKEAGEECRVTPLN